jgi:hypothetical protein
MNADCVTDGRDAISGMHVQVERERGWSRVAFLLQE